MFSSCEMTLILILPFFAALICSSVIGVESALSESISIITGPLPPLTSL